MTEHNIDNPPEWHPALEDAIRTRPVLAQSLGRNPQLAHTMRLLSLFLNAVDQRQPSEHLTRELVADLVPSDQHLIEEQARIDQAIHEFEQAMVMPPSMGATELLTGRRPSPVQLVRDAVPEAGWRGRFVLDGDGIHQAVKPVASYVEPCPECRSGKCPNCTGQTLDADDELVPCPCRHDGAGVLVLPRSMDAGVVQAALDGDQS